ncbi:MAG: 4Fe-4S binding protein [Eggerthellaceae bacterium]|nr:4Fe-4S binding protein [Eggerthellaceae bacterium]
MIRTVIEIDEGRCDGCGLCVRACHEGAIGLVDGKAKLLRDDYCDGMGDCLPACPAGAISFVEREAAPYDEAAVKANMQASILASEQSLNQPSVLASVQSSTLISTHASNQKLRNWPVQIKLAPINAPYFEDCDLLIAADCTAFACASFHSDCMAGRVTLIGCPKLDAIDYAQKLAAIVASNDIRSIMVARMQVPCCGGIERAARQAIEMSGKSIPLQVVTFATDGERI